MNITPVDAFVLFIAEAITEIGGYLLIAAILSFLAAAAALLPPRRHRASQLAWLCLLSSFAGSLTALLLIPIAYFLAPAVLVLTPFGAALAAYWAARQLAF
ncbi:hypothetical protein [Lacipirellula parvula]|uniref:Uncharacterized protein n=1 Tax=Lacipirellula parvula TaxID=2650471 RepID=A0A5K7X481_9BACT|nr:hypothetical protein [Lacipirellula parvula]BBO31340.1 hypothetical protein PLANPX_0952 [Lacipirellula parvula]